jgi:hypothetical protein
MLRKVNAEQFISEMIHKHNALRFWVKVWCPTHTYEVVLKPSLDDLELSPHGDPTKVSPGAHLVTTS